MQSAEPKKPTTPSRYEGIDIKFAERNPLPDFLIRKGKISVIFPFGSLSGSLTDLSSDPKLLGRPGVLRLLANDLKGMENIEVLGLIKPTDNFSTSLKIVITGIKMNNYHLIKDKQFPLVMNDGELNIYVNGSFSAEKLNAQIKFDFSKAKLAVDQTSDNKWLAVLGKAISHVNRFNVTASAKGNLDSYKMKVKSDLDQILNEALGFAFKDQVAQFREKLDAKITDKFNNKLKELNLDKHIKGIDSIDDLLANRENLANKILKSNEKKLKRAVTAQNKEQKTQLQRKANARKSKLQKKANSQGDQLKSKLKKRLKF